MKISNFTRLSGSKCIKFPLKKKKAACSPKTKLCGECHRSGKMSTHPMIFQK